VKQQNSFFAFDDYPRATRKFWKEPTKWKVLERKFWREPTKFKPKCKNGSPTEYVNIYTHPILFQNIGKFTKIHTI
jgi:hypothetical protein